MTEYDLFLVSRPDVNSTEDFEELAEWIMKADRRISAGVVPDEPHSMSAIHASVRPTLVFSPGPLRRMRPGRGAILQGKWLPKSVECARLAASGLPVPRFARMTASSCPKVEDFGSYVVVKPDVGARGADVHIARAKGLSWVPPKTSTTRILGGPLSASIVQEFIYTGPWPVSYRVATLFGEVLWSVRIEADRSRKPLLGPDGFAEGTRGAGASIVSSGKGCTMALSAEPDLLTLAREVHRVFAELPLLGIDFVRDHATGKPYIVEVNSAGLCWHFSSPGGQRMQREFDFDLAKQWDGRRLAARVLAERTVDLARS